MTPPQPTTPGPINPPEGGGALLADENPTAPAAPTEGKADKPNRMVEENGVDLDAASDTSPARTGNAYGMSLAAAKNFHRDAKNAAKLARLEAQRLEAEAKDWGKRVAELEREQEGDE